MDSFPQMSAFGQPGDVVFLLARLGLLVLLYGFLTVVAIVTWRSIRNPDEKEQPSEPQAFLEVLAAGAAKLEVGGQLPLGDEVKLGRTDDNDLVLSDPFVSSHNTVIRKKGGRWWVEDLGSRNGTYVEETRLAQPTLLTEGDRIRIGDVQLRFHERTKRGGK